MNMKKFLAGAISICIIGSASGNLYEDFAYALSEDIPTSGSCGTNATWSIDEVGVLTISGTGEIEDTMFSLSDWIECGHEPNKIIIEEGITSIGRTAFNGNTNAAEIIIPDTVTSIGLFAFNGCHALTELNIPASVTEIANYICSDTTELENVFVDDSNPNYCDIDGVLCTKDLSVMMFYPAAKKAAHYDIPDGVGGLFGTFHDNKYLTSVTIPDSVTSIGQESFYETKITSITLPESVDYIGGGAFHNCSELKTITIENPDCEIFDENRTICNSSGVLSDSDVYSSEYNGIIEGYAGSTAQAYAEKYGYTFVALDEVYSLGDVNRDGSINAIDASLVLTEYASMSTGQSSVLTETQKILANVNGDSSVNAIDASHILGYYAYTATGGSGSIEEFLK